MRVSLRTRGGRRVILFVRHMVFLFSRSAHSSHTGTGFNRLPEVAIPGFRFGLPVVATRKRAARSGFVPVYWFSPLPLGL